MNFNDFYLSDLKKPPINSSDSNSLRHLFAKISVSFILLLSIVSCTFIFQWIFCPFAFATSPRKLKADSKALAIAPGQHTGYTSRQRSTLENLPSPMPPSMSGTTKVSGRQMPGVTINTDRTSIVTRAVTPWLPISSDYNSDNLDSTSFDEPEPIDNIFPDQLLVSAQQPRLLLSNQASTSQAPIGGHTYFDDVEALAFEQRLALGNTSSTFTPTSTHSLFLPAKSLVAPEKFLALPADSSAGKKRLEPMSKPPMAIQPNQIQQNCLGESLEEMDRLETKADAYFKAQLKNATKLKLGTAFKFTHHPEYASYKF